MPSIHFLAASGSNYTVANRPSSSIRLVVIHVTESSAASAVTWFRNPKAQASANYVVGQDGSITQMVRDSDIAWHAGNWAINRQSIGIEHAGYTYRSGTFTDAEYRASARLVAAEMRHYLLPIDRKHIIGHSEVPDPNHGGLFGGFAHHTDPGPYWRWALYLGYVKTYARGGAPAPAIVSAPERKSKPSVTATVGKNNTVEVASSGLKDGATVSGYVKWGANVSAADVTRVEFLVDGRVRATGRSYEWDTTKEANGGHVLTLRVATKKGTTAGQSLRVNVANSPFTVAAANLTNGAAVQKTVRWEAVPKGASADHVDFLLDGKLINTEKDAPYLYEGDGGWDTTKTDNGPHTLTLRAVSVDGRVAEASVTVMVQNGSAQPKPKPTGASIVMVGLGDGAVVGGKVSWTAETSRATPKRVEFWVDGRWRWSESSAPWVYGGDGNLWDTAKERTGRHVVTVKAIMPDGSVSDWQSFTITIRSPLQQDAAPTPTSMAVTSSIADGATLHGGLDWTATVNGATPTSVDFFVDGRLRHTEHAAPYEFGTWDTSKEANGAHTLLVRATAADGTTADTTQTVQVFNATAATTISSQSVADGSTVSGSVAWTVTTSGPRPSRVEFWVDGRLKSSDTSLPYGYAWDTTLETSGVHTLVAKAISGTTVDQRTATVTVSNAAQRTTIATSSLSSGQTVSGAVSWAVTTAGAPPDKIEYSVDGALRATGSPYAWDTTKDADGTHTVLVRVTAGTQTDERSFPVTVRNTVSVKSSTITSGQTLSGTKTWTVTTQGPAPDKLELAIDGAVVATGASYTWDTTKAAEGAHTLVVTMTAGAQVVQTTYAVTVANKPTVKSSTIASGATVYGTQTWTVTTSTADKVELSIDGTVVAAGASYVWDTTKAAEGTHTLVVTMTRGSLVGTKTFTVTVANTPVISRSSLTGGILTGTQTWSVTLSGHAADTVELLVDGAVVATGTSYTWDTTTVADGTHTLLVKATAGSLVATKTSTVTVRNAPLAITSQSVSGGVWSVATNGERVEFYVDGALKRTDTRAPFSYTLDTTTLASGAHELVAKAYLGTQSTTATTTIAVDTTIGVTQNLANGQVLKGAVSWTATPTGSVAGVQFLINGSSAGTFTSPPWGGTLDTTRLANGSYTFAVRATGRDGSVVTASAAVTVQN